MLNMGRPCFFQSAQQCEHSLSDGALSMLMHQLRSYSQHVFMTLVTGTRWICLREKACSVQETHRHCFSGKSEGYAASRSKRSLVAPQVAPRSPRQLRSFQLAKLTIADSVPTITQTASCKEPLPGQDHVVVEVLFSVERTLRSCCRWSCCLALVRFSSIESRTSIPVGCLV